MARRPQKEPVVMRAVGLMLRANGIVGAQLAELDRLPEVFRNPLAAWTKPPSVPSASELAV